MSEMYYSGLHANTVYQDGDRCVPIGPGDTIVMSDDDMNDLQNAHLFASGWLSEPPVATQDEIDAYGDNVDTQLLAAGAGQEEVADTTPTMTTAKAKAAGASKEVKK